MPGAAGKSGSEKASDTVEMSATPAQEFGSSLARMSEAYYNLLHQRREMNQRGLETESEGAYLWYNYIDLRRALQERATDYAKLWSKRFTIKLCSSLPPELRNMIYDEILDLDECNNKIATSGLCTVGPGVLSFEDRMSNFPEQYATKAFYCDQFRQEFVLKYYSRTEFRLNRGLDRGYDLHYLLFTDVFKTGCRPFALIPKVTILVDAGGLTSLPKLNRGLQLFRRGGLRNGFELTIDCSAVLKTQRMKLVQSEMENVVQKLREQGLSVRYINDGHKMGN